MKKTMYLACFLGILCAIFGGAISYVNELTAPIIAQQAMAAETAIFKELDSEATFSEIDITSDASGFIKKGYYGKSSSNEYYIYSVSVVGFNTGSSIDFIIGFNKSGDIVLYNVISQQETEGIGSRVTTEEFSSTVLNTKINDSISVLSGATVSSSAVINGINAAKAMYGESAGVAVETQEVEAPSLNLGEKVSLNSEFNEFKAECTQNENDEEGNLVFACSARGYGLIDPTGHNAESGHEYSKNEILVMINAETKEVVKIEKVAFGDTEGIGDVAFGEEYLEIFEKATIDSEIDTVTNATWSSKSVASMVQAALKMVE